MLFKLLAFISGINWIRMCQRQQLPGRTSLNKIVGTMPSWRDELRSSFIKQMITKLLRSAFPRAPLYQLASPGLPRRLLRKFSIKSSLEVLKMRTICSNFGRKEII